MPIPMLTFTESRSPALQLTFGNEDGAAGHYSPSEFTVSVDLGSLRAAKRIDAVRLEIPASWVSDRPLWRPVSPDDDAIEWRVSACGVPRTLKESIRLFMLNGGQEVETREVKVETELRLASQFDPDEYVIARPNSVEGWGVVEPSRKALDMTFTWVPFRDIFFGGLYRSIVFMNGDGSNPGGLCTGMARAALERSLTAESDEPSLDEVILWHGRQLSDRALISGAVLLFFGSPARAFRSFRDDLLRNGWSDRCFDIGVPRPWRRDLVSALQGQGHTVVPYAIEQGSPNRARVLVYDPNDPARSRGRLAAITFLLDEDRYAYEPFGDHALERTTVIAARQVAYRQGRTAALAAIASVVMAAIDAVRSARTRSDAPVQANDGSMLQSRHS